MTPTFRYGILMANDKIPPKLTKGNVDDNLLHQLQKMFGFLCLTDR